MTLVWCSMTSPGGGRDAAEEGRDLVAQLVPVVERAKDDRVLGVGGDEHGVGEGGRLVGSLHTHHVTQRQNHPHQPTDLEAVHVYEH